MSSDIATTAVHPVLSWVRAGRPVVLLDDKKEHEGDLFCAAQVAIPETLQFMIRSASGLLCIAMPRQRLEEMGLPRMSVLTNLLCKTTWRPGIMPDAVAAFATSMASREAPDTPFHIPVDLRGQHSGISVIERFETATQLMKPEAHIDWFDFPGHLFTLGASEGGLSTRWGHTEAAVELAKAAGLAPAGLLCEVVGDDGDMLRGEGLVEFAREHGIEIVSLRTVHELTEKNEEAQHVPR